MTSYTAMDLIRSLTLEQKASLVAGDGPWHTQDLAEFGIPRIMLSDGPTGLRRQEDMDFASGDLFGADVSTCFPPAVSLGSTWNPQAARKVGAAIGQEARRLHTSVVLGPGINIKRSVRCGRNFEYFSEDPLLSAQMGIGWVDGLQGEGVGSSVKHFAAHNQETNRMTVSAEIDTRTLHEIYLRAFKNLIEKADPWTVMASYNRINGVASNENHWLLTDLLRDEWGYEGLVVSDWGAVQVASTSIAAGVNLQMPGNEGMSAAQLVGAVNDGSLLEADLDEAVERVIQLVLRSMEAGTVEGTDNVETLEVSDELFASHNELAIQVAAQGAVLLKNDANFLPLDGEAEVGSIALIGAFAEKPRFQGSGSSQVTAWRVTSALDAFRSRFGDQVPYAQGYRLDSEIDEALSAEAVEVAKEAQTVVLFLGLPEEEETEGSDREHIDIPEVQEELLAELLCVNENIVVVLSTGGPVAVAQWADAVPAILDGRLGGQGAGEAFARILLGEVNPSGRLAETVPLRVEDAPDYVNFPGEAGRVLYGERVFVGYRWYDELLLEVAYPFGHGLSYTQFEYSNLTIEGDTDSLNVSFDLENVGGRAGAEVAQVYVGKRGSKVSRAPKELKGFSKVELEPGEKTRISLDIDASELAYYSVESSIWAVEKGVYSVEVGASSRDIRLEAEVVLAGNEPEAQLDIEMTLELWLENGRLEPVLNDLLTPLDMSRTGSLFNFSVQSPMRILAMLTKNALNIDLLRLLAEKTNGGASTEELRAVVSDFSA